VKGASLVKMPAEGVDVSRITESMK
jgi:hypothetical protein